MKKKSLYWILQFFGWSIFSLVNFIFFVSGNDVSISDKLTFLSWIPCGILITHFSRLLILNIRIIQLPTYFQLPLAIVFSSINGLAFYASQYLIESVILFKLDSFGLMDNLADILNLTFVFFVWYLFYFSYHFLINQRKAEIQKLKWEANIKEIELNKLKSQLNPHFMFNSMNSIRALIDENPMKAKEAITQLSNILRNTLMIEKNNVIPFFDEIKLVADYLNLEKIRFEERLTYSIEAGLEGADYFVPPLLIQTLIENGIKHGISKYTEGGIIQLKTELNGDLLKINIKNTGVYDRTKASETGYGINASTDRLKYLFGEKASIIVFNDSPNLVNTEIILPLYTIKSIP